jgi:hypothetical protein
MALKDFPLLAGGIGGARDPWVERDRFTAGNPEQIYLLARGFAKAGHDAAEAARLAKKASEMTGLGYRVDRKSVHDIEENVAKTKKLLDEPQLRRVSQVLGGIGDQLSDRTGFAKQGVLNLEIFLHKEEDALKSDLIGIDTIWGRT